MKEHLGRRNGLLTAMRQAKDLSASERHVVEYVLENLKNVSRIYRQTALHNT